MALDDHALVAGGAVVLVNVFTPKPGLTDAFIKAQTDEYRRLVGQVVGALGNRLLRSLDGRRVVNLAYFQSEALYDAWRRSDLFADHLERIRHLVDTVEPALYTAVYESA
jgi:heme-degrading monooxygenase HmoA